MAYANVKGEQANHLMRKIPYTIIPGEEGKLRKDIFLERAIVEERVRLAMGLPTRRMDPPCTRASKQNCSESGTTPARAPHSTRMRSSRSQPCLAISSRAMSRMLCAMDISCIVRRC